MRNDVIENNFLQKMFEKFVMLVPLLVSTAGGDAGGDRRDGRCKFISI